MDFSPQLLLVISVAVVGVFHTVVPDHWVPIALIARQRGWSKGETARAALQAGVGHVVSTLIIASVIWFAGVAVAARFGHFIDTAASIALVGFGGWIAIASLREMRRGAGHSHSGAHRHGHSDDFSIFGDQGHEDARGHDHHDHGHGHGHGDDHNHDGASDLRDDPLYAPMHGGAAVLARHRHAHRHGAGPAHVHWHDHDQATSHSATSQLEAEPPQHMHNHKTNARTTLLLILGSSPMVEGIPAFFAAGKYGVGVIGIMAVVFALSTIATYVVLCVYSTIGFQRIRLGAFERYGEVLSGAFIALVGVTFWLWPAL
jgi:hypothetical protein